MIALDEFLDRLLRLAVDRGPRRFPRRRRDRQILIKSILMLMDSSRSYSEREINLLLRARGRDVTPAICTDHVTLRRLLVDHGLLERSPDGAEYRVGFPPAGTAFELEVEDVDVRATVAAYLEHERRGAGKRRRSR
ncbi:MAG: DUF2087 domain-containing protein [Deltaproteobacteria bacterium]|nr:DUF2087 domain-containing protein [Deltaproteobacteria bacterium]